MKKFILYPILALVSMIIFSLFLFMAVLFFYPRWIINPNSINFVLRHTNILEKWSWDEARIDIDWEKWNKRHLHGHFKNLCFIYDRPSAKVDSCIREFSWDFKLGYQLMKKFKTHSNRPVLIHSSHLNVMIKNQENTTAKKKAVNVHRIWTMLWGDAIPNFDLKFDKNILLLGGREYEFDLAAEKIDKKLTLNSLGFHLWANPKEFEILAPERYQIPKLRPRNPIYAYNVKLHGDVTRKGIPIALTGNVENIQVKLKSYLDLPVREYFSDLGFRKTLILNTTVELYIPNVTKSVGKFSPQPFNILPAPLNSMNGFIKMQFKAKDTDRRDVAHIESHTTIDLKSKEQVFLMDIGGSFLLSLLNFRPETIFLDFDFEKVHLRLPRLSKRELPPQFFPDRRIKVGGVSMIEAQEEKKERISTTYNLVGTEEASLHIRSNLFKNPLRLNFNFLFSEGEIQSGHIKSLPLRLEIFRRRIDIPSLRVIFNYPKEPILVGDINFLLPEYKITMSVEGPISKPRFAFVSDPPLSRADIYSVLLFGRPMNDLAPGEQQMANETDQMLAQGLVSLSVLYFLAGSPVEFIGYDPNSRTAMAQFRLGSRSSLRVGRDSEGINSTSIRQSIGRGWYVDTSATNTQKMNPASSSARDYGVLLERIFAY